MSSSTSVPGALPDSLNIPLFALEKALAVQPRSKTAPVRRDSRGAATPPRGDREVTSPTSFLSGIFGGVAEGDPREDPRASRREFVAATCTSAASTRLDDPPPVREFHAAAHSSEGGTKHHLLLRSQSALPSEDEGDRPPVLRALPWYEGERARITSLEFSPGPAHDRLLCGTAGGGAYVIHSGAILARAGSEDGDGTGDGDGGVPPIPGDTPGDGAAPTIQVLCNAGPGIVSVLWWRRRARDAASAGDDAVSSLVPAPSPVAVACASSGAIHFWDGVWGARLCSVTIPGRIERAELVDAGDTLGQ